MNKEDLRTLLNQPYLFDNWKKVVDFTFPNVSYLRNPITIPADDNLVESFQQVGTVRLNDGKNLAMFEVHVKPNVNIARNRVALRNLVSKYIDQERNHGVLAIYEKGTDEYRFTFTAKDTDYDESTGNFVDKETETKRFTYVLGANESCRTARDRFWELSQHKEEATIKDVENAFSVEKLSKEFFNKYKEHYTAFVNYLNNSSYKISAFSNEDKAIRDFVKIMLGRIVFLHFVQKKGWLGATDENYQDGDKQFMYKLWQNSGKRETFYQLILAPLFFDALNQNNRPEEEITLSNGQTFRIPYLGGGLFEKDRNEPDFLTFPKSLFENLFDFFNEYNFTIDENDPHENEIGIDPEMLGHIFENLLEDNKDKGAFYTPKPIVKYMCQESLIQYLLTSIEKAGLAQTEEEKTKWEEKVGRFVRKYEGGGLIEQERLLAQALYDIKVCDPAIGSGAFPMGILNEMVMLINVLHDASFDVVEDIWEMDNWQPATVKKHIIQNSIYGVDIEKGAVDIARLRFWLSLIIDEDKPTTLPSLDYKIVVGNSLISRFEEDIIDIDWELKEEVTQGNIWGDENEKARIKILNEITDKQLAFFKAENHQKEKLKKEIRSLKIDLLINQLQLQIKKRGLDKVQSNAIGKILISQTDLYLKTQGWKNSIIKLKNLKNNPQLPFNHFDWQLDFPEVLNPSIANNTGFDIVIGNPPYKTFSKDQGEELYYKYETVYANELYSLFYELSISHLLKVNKIITFITASLFLKGIKFQSLREYLQNNLVKVNIRVEGDSVFENVQMPTLTLIARKSENKDNNWKITDFINDFALLSKIESQKVKIRDIFKIMRGLEIGKDKTSLLSGKVPILTGTDVKKFVPKKPRFTTEDVIKNYKKDRVFFDGERLLVRETGSELTTLYLDNFIWSNRSLYSLKKKNKNWNIFYVLGIMNSNLIQFYYKTKFRSETEIFPKIRIAQVQELPILECENQIPIAEIVARIVELKLKDLDTHNLENQVDYMVFKLYELNYDEVLVVDPEFEMSEEEYEAFEIE